MQLRDQVEEQRRLRLAQLTPRSWVRVLGLWSSSQMIESNESTDGIPGGITYFGTNSYLFTAIVIVTLPSRPQQSMLSDTSSNTVLGGKSFWPKT